MPKLDSTKFEVNVVFHKNIKMLLLQKRVITTLSKCCSLTLSKTNVVLIENIKPLFLLICFRKDFFLQRKWPCFDLMDSTPMTNCFLTEKITLSMIRSIVHLLCMLFVCLFLCLYLCLFVCLYRLLLFIDELFSDQSKVIIQKKLWLRTRKGQSRIIK